MSSYVRLNETGAENLSLFVDRLAPDVPLPHQRVAYGRLQSRVVLHRSPRGREHVRRRVAQLWRTRSRTSGRACAPQHRVADRQLGRRRPARRGAQRAQVGAGLFGQVAGRLCGGAVSFLGPFGRLGQPHRGILRVPQHVRRRAVWMQRTPRTGRTRARVSSNEASTAVGTKTAQITLPPVREKCLVRHHVGAFVELLHDLPDLVPAQAVCQSVEHASGEVLKPRTRSSSCAIDASARCLPVAPSETALGTCPTRRRAEIRRRPEKLDRWNHSSPPSEPLGDREELSRAERLGVSMPDSRIPTSLPSCPSPIRACRIWGSDLDGNPVSGDLSLRLHNVREASRNGKK